MAFRWTRSPRSACLTRTSTTEAGSIAGRAVASLLVAARPDIAIGVHAAIGRGPVEAFERVGDGSLPSLEAGRRSPSHEFRTKQNERSPLDALSGRTPTRGFHACISHRRPCRDHGLGPG